MRSSEDIARLLDDRLLDRGAPRLSQPCDLDLLRFFRRHPQTLLTSEQLAACVGYEVPQVGRSLDTLLGAGLVTRSQNPRSVARMYLLTSGGTLGEWLKSLLEVAATQEGRRALIKALATRPPSRGPSEADAARTPRSDRVKQEASHD